MPNFRYIFSILRRRFVFVYLFVTIILTIAFYSHFLRKLFKVKVTCDNYKNYSINLSDQLDQSCRLTIIDPYNPTVLEIMSKEPLEPLDCTKPFPIWFDSRINDNQQTVKLFPIVRQSKNLKFCCYRKILFNGQEFSKDCFPVSLVKETVVSPEHDFISIECTFLEEPNVQNNMNGRWWRKYKTRIVDMHAFVHLKNKLDGLNDNVKNNVSSPNVIILGIDSMSRMNFYRTMRKTHSFLANTLNAVELQGMNKIGDNTFPNIGAMLTNSFVSDDYQISCFSNGSPETCDFIWLKYAQKGYRILYAEDEVSMGLFRNLELGGINYTPKSNEAPEFYFSPFLQVFDKYLGHEKKITSNWCLGPRPALRTTLEYFKSMMIAMKKSGENFFQFGWFTAFTHDYLNGGRLADIEIRSFLDWCYQNGYLESTIIFLMSDHGTRIGEIRGTDQGQLEERSPLLYIVLPNSWTSLYPNALQNLRNNRKRLITFWDVRQTLEHILQAEYLEDDKLQNYHEINRFRTEDFSLFLPVPSTRTCKEAGVPLRYCTCNRKSEVLSVYDSFVVELVDKVINFFNSVVETYSKCAKLSLGKVLKARKVSFRDEALSSWKAFLVVFDTVPGWTTFDALFVQENGTEGPKWIARNIGRSTWYWTDQTASHCLGDWSKNLKGVMDFCYCL